MPWFIFALLGAFFDAAYYTLVKKWLQNLNPLILSGGAFFIASLFLLMISLIKGIPPLGPALFSSVFATGAINVVGAMLYLKALHTTDISLVMPMTAFTPAFLLLTSFVLLHELPTAIGLAGVLLIAAGSYVLNVRRDHAHFLDPIRAILRNRGTRLMLAVALLFSISANFDKLVVLNSDPFFGSFLVFFLAGSVLLLIACIKEGGVLHALKENAGKLLAAGAVLVGTVVTMNIAFTLQIVPYSIAVKRLSILFAVLAGAVIFKEKHIKVRIAGAVIMLAGALLIILF